VHPQEGVFGCRDVQGWKLYRAPSVDGTIIDGGVTSKGVGLHASCRRCVVETLCLAGCLQQRCNKASKKEGLAPAIHV